MKGTLQEGNYTQVEKKFANAMLRKATKVHVYAQCFSLSFLVWKDLLRFDTTDRYSQVNICHHEMGPMVLTLAKNENIQFFFKTTATWVMIKIVVISVTTPNFIPISSLA